MLGMSAGELLVIGIILLVAVGPKRMPTVMKSAGRAMREFRKATMELRAQSGIDEMLNDDDLRNPMKPKSRPLVRDAQKDAVVDAFATEHPAQGVDIAEARVRSGSGENA